MFTNFNSWVERDAIIKSKTKELSKLLSSSVIGGGTKMAAPYWALVNLCTIFQPIFGDRENVQT